MSNEKDKYPILFKKNWTIIKQISTILDPKEKYLNGSTNLKIFSKISLLQLWDTTKIQELIDQTNLDVEKTWDNQRFSLELDQEKENTTMQK